MPLKDDLLRKGYLPENLPPTFVTDALGAKLAAHSGWLTGTDKNKVVRASPFNASKRGMTRREFSVIHPSTAHDLARFVEDRKSELEAHFNRSRFSLSKPMPASGQDRAISITPHSELDSERLSRLSHYRFVVRTDISRFYHSIYTHSIPWAVHGRATAKADRQATSARCFANRLDLIIRNGQDGQTIGIPVGPDASRYAAELIGTAIDEEFVKRGGDVRCDVIRHVDDIWIGANTHDEAEKALGRYREAIRFFELDINEAKTAIHSSDFSFSDIWPTEISHKLEAAETSSEHRTRERLRAALEYAFELTNKSNDDGILKYTLHKLDRSELPAGQWPAVEPFLKRAAVHFGHTIDYVTRILVWRHLAFDDLDKNAWAPILEAILNRHGRLGNDAEVCWALYAAIRLKVYIREETANLIIENCGAMSIISLLSCADLGLLDSSAFDFATTLVATETAAGPYWPLLLEWTSRQWPKHQTLNLANSLIEDLAKQKMTIFDNSRLPRAFWGVDEDKFRDVPHAIEENSSQYDDKDEDGEDDR